MATGIQISPPSGITIGTTAIDSGVDTRVLFQQGGVVQQDANFTFNNTQKRLTLKAVGTAATDIPFVVQNSAGTANLINIQGNNIGNFSKVYFDLNSGVPQLFNIDTSAAAGTSILLGTSTISLRDANTNFIRFIGGGVRSIAVNNGTANTGLADAFELYSSDRGGTAGKASAHFRAEDGTINVIGDLSGIGTATPQARLDVRAQGTLSTDIAFRVRNSGDTVSLLDFQGTGNLITRHNSSGSSLGLFHRTDTTGFSLTTGTSGYGTGTGIEIQGTSVWILDSGARQFRFTSSSGNDGDLWTFQNNGTGAGKRMSLSKSGSETFCWTGENYSIGGNIWGNTPTETNSFGIKNGTAPTTNATDAFKMYSADIVAGNAAPHFRTEAGQVIKLYRETTANLGTGAAFVNGTGAPITEDATFGGYTIAQITKALANFGLLQ